MSKKRDAALSLYDQNTVAPDRLNISDGMRNEHAIAVWWSDVRLFVDAMQGLDRATMLHHDETEGIFYLSSIPSGEAP